jgi:hypothetical protein
MQDKFFAFGHFFIIFQLSDQGEGIKAGKN